MLFIVFDNGAAKTPAANLSKPEAFLALTSLSSFLTSSVVVCGIEGIYMLKMIP